MPIHGDRRWGPKGVGMGLSSQDGQVRARSRQPALQLGLCCLQFCQQHFLWCQGCSMQQPLGTGCPGARVTEEPQFYLI